MVKWLTAVVLAFSAASAAHAQLKGMALPDIADVARTRTLDLRLMQERGVTRPAPLVDGMIARRGVAPNMFVGFGFARMYGRKKRGDSRVSDQPSTRKPAVTFVLKF